MSPEEQQRLMAQMLMQKQQQQPGMISQSSMSPEAMAQAQAQAAQSTAGARSKLAQQQAYADKLRGAPVPEGRQAGGLFLAASPLEGLASVFQQYQGGKLSRELEDKYDDVDKAETKVKKAKLSLAVEAARLKEAGVDKRSTDDRTSRESTNAATIKGANERNRLTLAAKKLADDATRTDAKGKRVLKTFHDPSGKGTLTLQIAPDGTGIDQATGKPYPVELVGALTPYTAPQTGSVAEVKKAKYDRGLSKEKDTLILDADMASKAVTDPLLRTATGPWYDPAKLATSLGMPGFEAAQATQTNAAAVSMTAAAPILDKLGINPTDVDLKEAFKTAPNDTKQPEVWVDWYENRYMPSMSKALMRDNPEIHDRVMQEMSVTLEEAKTVHEPQYNPFADEEEQTPEDSGWSVREVQ
jgi:hypothetical protein